MRLRFLLTIDRLRGSLGVANRGVRFPLILFFLRRNFVLLTAVLTRAIVLALHGLAHLAVYLVFLRLAHPLLFIQLFIRLGGSDRLYQARV